MKNYLSLATFAMTALSMNESCASSEADAVAHILSGQEPKKVECKVESYEKEETPVQEALPKKNETQNTDLETMRNERTKEVMTLSVLLAGN
jgi:hypothetical protein